MSKRYINLVENHVVSGVEMGVKYIYGKRGLVKTIYISRDVLKIFGGTFVKNIYIRQTCYIKFLLDHDQDNVKRADCKIH